MENKYYASFTEVLHDAYLEDPDILSGIVDYENINGEELKEHIIARWGMYEIAGETHGAFKQMITDKFIRIKSELNQQLEIYNTKFEWEKGKVKTTEHNKTNTDTKNDSRDIKDSKTSNSTSNNQTTSSSNSSGENNAYAFPNKVTNSEYKTGKTDSSSTDSSTNTDKYTNESTESGTKNDTFTSNINKKEDGTITESGGVEFADIRNKWLKSVVDLYDRYAEKFSDCFLTLYY